MLNVGLHLDGTPRHQRRPAHLARHPPPKPASTSCSARNTTRTSAPTPRKWAIETEPGDLTVHDGRMWHRVARSPLVGEASRRRVMYVPILAGKYEPKHDNSPTPFYLRFLHLVK